MEKLNLFLGIDEFYKFSMSLINLSKSHFKQVLCCLSVHVILGLPFTVMAVSVCNSIGFDQVGLVKLLM